MTRSYLEDSRPPFFQCQNRILELGLDAYAIAVYCVLAKHADRQRRCFPSQRRIAKILGISTSTVNRALKTLRAHGAIRWTVRQSEHGDRDSHLYELIQIPEQGRSATDTPVPPDEHGVRPQIHGCSPGNTEQYPIEQYSLKGEGKQPPADTILDQFEEGFKKRCGHKPTITAKQQERWRRLRASHPADLIAAKIAAWWDYPLRHDFTGNRTLAAFLQWFDDIPVNGTTPPPGQVLTPDEIRQQIRDGTSAGRSLFQSQFGGLEEDAQIRMLIKDHIAKDEDDAKRIIAACSGSTGSTGG